MTLVSLDDAYFVGIAFRVLLNFEPAGPLAINSKPSEMSVIKLVCPHGSPEKVLDCENDERSDATADDPGPDSPHPDLLGLLLKITNRRMLLIELGTNTKQIMLNGCRLFHGLLVE
jgi:hypothetical protein